MSNTVYTYFVSFCYEKDGRYGYGDCSLGVDFKIDNIEVINGLRDILKSKYGHDSIVIMNIIEMSE